MGHLYGGIDCMGFYGIYDVHRCITGVWDTTNNDNSIVIQFYFYRVYSPLLMVKKEGPRSIAR